MRVEHKPKGTGGQAVKPVLPPPSASQSPILPHCLQPPSPPSCGAHLHQPLRLPPGSVSTYKAHVCVSALFLRTLHVDLHLMFFIRHVSKMILYFIKCCPLPVKDLINYGYAVIYLSGF